MSASTDLSASAAPVAALVVISEDWAADRKPRNPPKAPAPATPSAPRQVAVELTDQRIRKAVAQTIAATPDQSSVAANQQEALRAPMLSAEQYKTFAKGFAYAKVPYCRGDGGLKFQPPKIGPIVFGGLLAIPFVLVAAVRVKCK